MKGRSTTSRSSPERRSSTSYGSPATVSVTCHRGSALSDVTLPSATPVPSSSVVQQHQVVPVDDLSLVRGSELAGELSGRASQHPGKLARTIVHQPAGDGVAVFVAEVPRVPRRELSLHPHDAGRQQRQ